MSISLNLDPQCWLAFYLNLLKLISLPDEDARRAVTSRSFWTFNGIFRECLSCFDEFREMAKNSLMGLTVSVTLIDAAINCQTRKVKHPWIFHDRSLYVTWWVFTFDHFPLNASLRTTMFFFPPNRKKFALRRKCLIRFRSPVLLITVFQRYMRVCSPCICPREWTNNCLESKEMKNDVCCFCLPVRQWWSRYGRQRRSVTRVWKGNLSNIGV